MFKFINLIENKLIIFNLFLALLFNSTSAQLPLLSWANGIGSNANDEGKALAVDDSGNVYISGQFYGTVDFDPNVSNTYNLQASNCDIFVSKINSSGSLVWAKRLGGGGYDIPNSITLDASGNVYIMGTYTGTADFNPDPIDSFNLYNGGSFICKLDNSGSFVWANSFNAMGSGNAIFGAAISSDEFGNLYFTGDFQGHVDFDPSIVDSFILNTPSHSCFICKISNYGKFIWAKKIDGYSSGITIAFNADEYIYIGGKFSNSNDSCDFDPSPNSSYYLKPVGMEDIFILKLDTSGAFKWARRIGGLRDDFIQSIKISRTGFVYSTGYFSANADFDPGNNTYNLTTTSNFDEDIFILKLDSSGSFVWAKKIGGSSSDRASTISIDFYNKVYLTGNFAGTTDFNPGTGNYNLTSNGVKDIFLTKLDSNGIFNWARKIGGSDNEAGLSIALDSSNNVYSTGFFSSTVDFDPNNPTFNITSNGQTDIFLLKLKQCQNTNSNNFYNSCDSIIINNITYYTSGNYSQSFINSNGCDSSFNIYLTIRHSSSSVFTFNSCDSFNFNGITYTNSGNYTQILQNRAGCDSIIRFILNIFKSNTSSINIVECDSFIANNLIFRISGTYYLKLKTISGCDSIVTLNLTIKKSSSSTLYYTSCDSLTLNNFKYKTSGNYLQKLSNAAGCDSLVNINLTIKNSTSSFQSFSACDSFLFNSRVLDTSGVFEFHTINANGCDSIIILNLTIKRKSTKNLYESACKAYSLNGITYTNSGIYIQSLINSVGCDSILVLNLTINNLDSTVSKNGADLSSNETGAQYQWLNCKDNLQITGAVFRTFTATSNGNYSVIISKNLCTDTSECVSINNIGFNQFSTNKRFKILPNPIDKWINLYCADANLLITISLYDIEGRVVFSKDEYSNEHLILDVSMLVKGVYLIEIIESGIIYRSKIFIQ